MDTISSISELLTLSQSQFRVYDIGRKIEKISKEQFNKIELNQLPFPNPIQGHAMLALAFWQKDKHSPYLWFIKLPLDERGLLNQGARNHFIAIIMEALGSDLTQDPTEKQEELLKSNPYNFTPSQYKLAHLNSEIALNLSKSHSKFLDTFKAYISGELGWENWHNIGVQGITDFVVRINDEPKYQEQLIRALPYLPLQVLQPLCSSLENVSLPAPVVEAMIKRYKKEAETPHASDLLRSLATSCEHPFCTDLFANILTKPLSHELLVVIAGRNWNALKTEQAMLLFLEQLAKTQNKELFPAIFKDLVAIPLLRQTVFLCMRSENRSPELAQAIGKLFNQH